MSRSVRRYLINESRSPRKVDKLLKAIARREVDMVAAWSVDRLGGVSQSIVGLVVGGYWGSQTGPAV
jgi:hypothetical protein